MTASDHAQHDPNVSLAWRGVSTEESGPSRTAGLDSMNAPKTGVELAVSKPNTHLVQRNPIQHGNPTVPELKSRQRIGSWNAIYLR